MYALQLPRLGQTMEVGTISTWFKAEGDQIDVGEPVYAVETEKVTMDVEAKRPGTLLRIVAQDEEEVPVGTLLAVVAEGEEDVSPAQVDEFIASFDGSSAAVVDPSRDEVPTSASRDEPRPASTRVAASPRARALAQELGVDLDSVTPSDPATGISEADVRGASSGKSSARRRLTATQRAMAATMEKGWREIPQFSQTIEVDADSMLLRRRSTEAGSDVGDRSVTDIVIDAILMGVSKVPEANARYLGDSVELFDDVDLSVAVETDRGLVTPVLRSAQRLSPSERTQTLKELVDRARSDDLTLADVDGGTIAVSNLGMRGILTGVPLVMPGQTCIVFVGSFRSSSVGAADDVPTSMFLTAAYDHRVIDGAMGASFLAAVREELERTG